MDILGISEISVICQLNRPMKRITFGNASAPWYVCPVCKKRRQAYGRTYCSRKCKRKRQAPPRSKIYGPVIIKVPLDKTQFSRNT